MGGQEEGEEAADAAEVVELGQLAGAGEVGRGGLGVAVLAQQQPEAKGGLGLERRSADAHRHGERGLEVGAGRGPVAEQPIEAPEVEVDRRRAW